MSSHGNPIRLVHRHRGAHPKDRKLFAPEQLATIERAVTDLGWLLERGYAERSALVLVGDRYALGKRQRVAVGRSACAESRRLARLARRRELAALEGEPLSLDGFNVLITLEAAFGGGIVLVGADGCHRDLSSLHSSYREVAETGPAIAAIGTALAQRRIGPVTWYLDRPVGNSLRLRERLLDEAQGAGWPWRVELADNPDRALVATEVTIATSDAGILERCGSWVDLAGALISECAPHAWLVRLEPRLHGG